MNHLLKGWVEFMNGKYYWLKCKASEGMFPNEVAIKSKTMEGKPFSLFIHPDYLMKKDNYQGDNFLNVKVHKLDDSCYEVLLPVEPFETERIVRVNQDQIIVS